MMTVTEFFSSSWAQSLGWTLLHSLWQGLLIMALVFLIMRIIPSKFSEARYAIAVGALVFIFISSIATYIYLNYSVEKFSGRVEQFLQVTNVNHQIISLSNDSYASWLDKSTALIQANVPFILTLWIIGTILFSSRIVFGWWYLSKLKSDSLPLKNEWSEKIKVLAETLRIHKIIALAESAKVHAPMVIGYLKPIIIFPMGMFSGLSSEQIETILVHELMHIRRHDYVVNLVQSFAEAIFFFNPFVWLVSSIIRQERELCCDDAVVALHGNALAYARALTQLEEVRLSKTGLALSLAENKNQLLYRIKRIMEKSVKNNSGRERMVPILLLIVGVMCASWLTLKSKNNGTEFRSTDSGKIATDTVIKSKKSKDEKSASYSRKKITTVDEDGKTQSEVTEDFEGDKDLLPVIADVDGIADVDFDIPPVPEIDEIPVIADIEVFEVPPIPDLAFTWDSIPGPMAFHGRDWEKFSKEFEQSFKERFEDFYKNHEKDFEKMMKEVEGKFENRFDKEWAENTQLKAQRMAEHMQVLAKQQQEHAEMLARKMERNNDAMIHHQQNIKEMQDDMKRWELKQAEEMKVLEKNMKVMEENMKSFEKELKVQLVKDGYIGKDEKIKNMSWNDNGDIVINDKKIKDSDKKKYNELHQKFFKDSSGSFHYIE